MSRTRRFARTRLWQLIGVGLLALAAAAAVVLAAWSMTRPPGTAADVTQQNIAQDPGKTTLVVFGDEYATSDTVASDAKAWPQLISDQEGWNLKNLSAAGTGFLARPSGDSCVAASACPNILDQLPDAIAAGAAAVVFAPGTNDVGEPSADLADQMDEAFAAIHVGLPSAVVVVVGPTGNTASRSEVLALDAAIHAAATRSGVRYVSLLAPPAIGSDNLTSDGKLNAAGESAIASLVRSAIGTLP